MNLKQRFAIYFSLLFSALLAVVLMAVFYLFSHYRKEEFRLRLEEKALSTIKLLVEVKNIDRQSLRVIDQNSINKLFNEKVLVFDDSMQLIYASLDDAVIKWSKVDLEYLKANQVFYRHEGELDVYGVFYDSNEKDYFALVGAEDKYGHRQLRYLGYLLIFAFAVGTLSIWFLSYYVSARILTALEAFKDQIADISDKKLHLRLNVTDKNDEIDSLAHSFNQMMDRIDQSYKQQKEFTANASHELRTPVTRIIMQLHNLMQQEQHNEASLKYLNSIQNDATQMADIISSLLLLTRMEQASAASYMPVCRIDEVIFEAIQTAQKTFLDYHINFDIENKSANEVDVEIKGDVNLLKIVFVNLLKNAYNYSSDKQVAICIEQYQQQIDVVFSNQGKTLTIDERQNIFKAFVRGENSQNTSGIGLGLRIVERIINYHHAEIRYDAPNEHTNRFVISFKI